MVAESIVPLTKSPKNLYGETKYQTIDAPITALITNTNICPNSLVTKL